MKRNTKSITVPVLIAGLIAAGMLFLAGSSRAGLVTPVRAQETDREGTLARRFPTYCNIGTVSGSYAYSASGTITQPIPQLQIPAGPFAVTSLLTLSVGSLTFKGTQSFNGTVVPAVGVGTYTVNDDCTGTAVDNLGTTYNFVIADGGDEIRIMLALPNTVITGVAKRL